MTPKPLCGLAEHVHTDACYAMALACGMDGAEGHAHTDDCWQPVLACGMQEHVHGAACYPDTVSDPVLLPSGGDIESEVDDQQEMELGAFAGNAADDGDAGIIFDDPEDVPDIEYAPEAIEAFVRCDGDACRAGEPLRFELGHVGGLEPVRYHVMAVQGDHVLYESSSRVESLTLAPAADTDLTLT